MVAPCTAYVFMLQQKNYTQHREMRHKSPLASTKEIPAEGSDAAIGKKCQHPVKLVGVQGMQNKRNVGLALDVLMQSPYTTVESLPGFSCSRPDSKCQPENKAKRCYYCPSYI